jgi:hypothetical protein
MGEDDELLPRAVGRVLLRRDDGEGELGHRARVQQRYYCL